MKDFFVQLLPILLPLLLTALTAGTAWVAVHLANWLKAKAENSRAFAALAVLDDFIFSVVQDIEANEKEEVMKRLTNGAITGADASVLKTLAMTRVKALLGTSGLETLKKALEALLGGNLDTLLSGKIETAVAKVAAGPVPVAAVAAASAALTAVSHPK